MGFFPGHLELQLGQRIGNFKTEYGVWYDEVAIDDKPIGCTR